MDFWVNDLSAYSAFSAVEKNENERKKTHLRKSAESADVNVFRVRPAT